MVILFIYLVIAAWRLLVESYQRLSCQKNVPWDRRKNKNKNKFCIYPVQIYESDTQIQLYNNSLHEPLNLEF